MLFDSNYFISNEERDVTDIQNTDMQIEEEEDEEPYVEFDISVSPSDPTLELLSQHIDSKDIIVPFYQRKYVWKIEQASRLIESFLMGLPVPQVFLYVNNDEVLEIIDGQQRIMSIKYFFDGFFGEADNRDKRQVFKLKGLSERSEYNGKTFKELSEKDQRKLRNSTLRAINIKQLRPSSESDSVFHIFQRLNTGGTQLKPQEIRNAVYRGSIVSRLESINDNKDWQDILGLKRPANSQKDVELVLRLFSLYENWDSYEKPMLRFLNGSMSKSRDFSSDRAKKFENKFPIAVNKVNSVLTKPFRPKGVINTAMLEAVLITLLENEEITPDQLKSRYISLLENKEFEKYIRGGTTDTLVLKSRLSLAKKILKNA